MTTAAPDRIWSGIELPRILAGALAAVCAAVAGSFLGVAGTVIGAAVASIIGSVGTEIYARSIKKGTEKLQTLAPAFIKAPAAVGTPPVEAATDEDSPSHTTAETEAEEATEKPKVQIRWKRVALAAGLLFVLAMGALTAVELLAGRSMASIVGSDSAGGTTLSSVTNGGSQDAPAPVVSVTPTDGTTPTPGPSVSTEPTGTPSSGTPSTSSPSDTDTPTTEAPQQTPGDSTTGGPGTPQQEQQEEPGPTEE